MNTVLSGYYQSDTVNSIGNDKCLTGFFIRRGQLPGQPEPDVCLLFAGFHLTAELCGIDAFQIWSLSANFTKDGWGASVYVKNIFNEKGRRVCSRTSRAVPIRCRRRTIRQQLA